MPGDGGHLEAVCLLPGDTRFGPMPGPAAGTIGCVSVALPRHGRGSARPRLPGPRRSSVRPGTQPAASAGPPARPSTAARLTSPGGDTPCSTPPSDPPPLIVAYGAQVRQDMPAGRWCRGKGRQLSQPATDGDRQLALPPGRAGGHLRRYGDLSCTGHRRQQGHRQGDRAPARRGRPRRVRRLPRGCGRAAGPSACRTSPITVARCNPIASTSRAHRRRYDRQPGRPDGRVMSRRTGRSAPRSSLRASCGSRLGTRFRPPRVTHSLWLVAVWSLPERGNPLEVWTLPVSGFL